MSLKDLEHAIETVGEKEELEQRKRAAEAAARQAELARIKAQEDSLKDEKLQIARKVFAWVSDFSQTEIYKKILAVQNFADSVHIYGNGWGHKVPHESGFGCWSRLAVKPDGKLDYFFGFKSGSNHIEFATAEELAEKLNHRYLSSLSRAIETEEVYTITKDWHFRK